MESNKEEVRQRMKCMDRAVVKAMREWIEDCDESTVGRSNREVWDAVERNYEGGVEQFLVDGLLRPLVNLTINPY